MTGPAGPQVFQLTLISVLFLALTAMQRVVLDLLPIFVAWFCLDERGCLSGKHHPETLDPQRGEVNNPVLRGQGLFGAFKVQ